MHTSVLTSSCTPLWPFSGDLEALAEDVATEEARGHMYGIRQEAYLLHLGSCCSVVHISTLFGGSLGGPDMEASLVAVTYSDATCVLADCMQQD